MRQPEIDPAFAAASYSRDLALRVTPVPEVSDVHALPNALREISAPPTLARPGGWLRGAIVGGLAMGLVFVVVRASRKRSHRPARVRVANALVREVGARMLVAAASVVATRIATDVIAPRLAARLES